MALTPMMQQYMEVKNKYKDCILFYRLGDFYEMFFDDALTASRELELTLTGRDCGLAERAPMCGVPYHAVEGYLDRLIEKGYKVAICEQLEDPALAKGLVQRDVIRVVTPGTVIELAMLDERSNNFLLSACFAGDKAGLAFADVSTGEFFVHQVTDAPHTLADEVTRIGPVELITNDLAKLRDCIAREDLSMSEQPAVGFQYQNASEALCRHFHLQDLSPLGLTDEYRLAAQAAGALMRYLSDTQKNALEHITELRIYQGGSAMLLDRNTRRNLELTESSAKPHEEGKSTVAAGQDLHGHGRTASAKLDRAAAGGSGEDSAPLGRGGGICGAACADHDAQRGIAGRIRRGALAQQGEL